MKQANSFGTISLIDRKSKRRKPYRVQIQVGWKYDEKKDNFKPIRKTLGYVATRNEGKQMLADYHNNPYNKNADNLAFKILYEKWYNFKSKKVGISAMKRYSSMRKHYNEIEKEPFGNISPSQLQEIIDKSNLTIAYQRNIISIYSQMYQFAKDNNIKVGANASNLIIYNKGKKTTSRKVFTDDEIKCLWEHRNDIIDVILVLIFTGMRPNELLNYDEVHENYIVTGSKTESGKNRVVPLHNKIKDIFHNLVNKGVLKKYPTSDHLYQAAKKEFKLLNMGYHVPYEARHTFATLCKRAKVDDYSRKLIMGHHIADLTDRVYTHKLIEELIEEVNKI